MAEFQKVMADAVRMCNTMKDCTDCPCCDFCVLPNAGLVNAKLSEEKVEQWAAEHPVKTNRMALKEVFPNLPHIQNETIILTEEFLDSEYEGDREHD